MDDIPSVDEAFHNLGMFSFVELYLFSAGRRHSSDITDLLRLIERLKELHTEVQGIISSLHLSMTLIYDLSQRWSLYLNRCVPVLSS